MFNGLAILFSISFFILSIALVMLVIFLIRLTHRLEQKTELLLNDLHQISTDVTHLLENLNQFMDKDLHPISVETRHLISGLSELTSDVTKKSRSLNLLFKPLDFFNSKVSKDQGSASQKSSLPQVLGWIGSTMFLFKRTKKLFSNKK